MKNLVLDVQVVQNNIQNIEQLFIDNNWKKNL